jgi:hypothetical protein
MKRLALAALAVGTIVMAQPATAYLGTPGTWGPGESGVSPAYTLPVHVVDTMVGTLRPENRKAWRQARNEALTEWGIPLTVTRMDESALPYLFDDNIGTVGYDGMLIPDAILIVRNRMSVFADQGGYSATVNGGIAVISPWAPWWRPNGPMTSDIAHEVGHALGFNHGGTGVMMGAEHVNDEERALAQAYYLG